MGITEIGNDETGLIFLGFCLELLEEILKTARQNESALFLLSAIQDGRTEATQRQMVIKQAATDAAHLIAMIRLHFEQDDPEHTIDIFEIAPCNEDGQERNELADICLSKQERQRFTGLAKALDVNADKFWEKIQCKKNESAFSLVIDGHALLCLLP